MSRKRPGVYPPLVLHVGHSKTGSSFIQSALALSAANLSSRGVIYPFFHENVDAAAGKITAGNTQIFRLADAYMQTVNAHPSAQAVLFSRERLFHELLDHKDVLDGLRGCGVPVQVVLFIRNPVSHAVSRYCQDVKRGGFTSELPESLKAYDFPRKVTAFLDHMNARDVPVTVRNYSVHAGRLLKTVWDGLGLNVDAMVEPLVRRVNRSMTRSEIAIQKAFNAIYGHMSSRFISDRLCDELPDFPVEGGPPLTRADYDRFVDHVQPMIEDANTRIAVNERYVIEAFDTLQTWSDTDERGLDLNTAQVDVLRRSIKQVKAEYDVTSDIDRILKGQLVKDALSTTDLLVLKQLYPHLAEHPS